MIILISDHYSYIRSLFLSYSRWWFLYQIIHHLPREDPRASLKRVSSFCPKELRFSQSKYCIIVVWRLDEKRSSSFTDTECESKRAQPTERQRTRRKASKTTTSKTTPKEDLPNLHFAATSRLPTMILSLFWRTSISLLQNLAYAATSRLPTMLYSLFPGACIFPYGKQHDEWIIMSQPLQLFFKKKITLAHTVE